MNQTKGKIFLTDANYKHTLAAIRSLGRKKIAVDVGSNLPLSLGRFSKYARRYVMYPDAQKAPDRFFDFILRICRRNNYDVVMPIGYASTVTLSKFKDKIERFVKVPITDYEQMQVAAQKNKTMLLAQKLDIPIPRSLSVEETNSEDLPALKFPVVLKGVTESGSVHYVRNLNELCECFLLLHRLGHKALVIQDYIEGIGYGFFALSNHGEPRAFFMHRRIREYPVSGGASTFAESIYEPKLKEYGFKILRALNWHGVIMLEFKKDLKSNEFKLIEINPKFWGSLDLAIVSGVDFPYLLYRMAVDGDIESSFNYKIGMKFMWPFPDDFKHALANPSVRLKFIKDLLDPRVKKNIEFSDLKPNILQLFETATILR